MCTKSTTKSLSFDAIELVQYVPWNCEILTLFSNRIGLIVSTFLIPSTAFHFHNWPTEHFLSTLVNFAKVIA